MRKSPRKYWCKRCGEKAESWRKRRYCKKCEGHKGWIQEARRNSEKLGLVMPNNTKIIEKKYVKEIGTNMTIVQSGNKTHVMFNWREMKWDS